MNEILCYEKKRIYRSELKNQSENNYDWYILPENGAVSHPNECTEISDLSKTL